MTNPDPTSYQAQNENNSSQISVMFSQLFPNLTLSHDDIYHILSYLDQTSVNPQVLPRVIRSVQNIMIGTGQGEVLVHVRGETLTVEARERDGTISTKQVDTKA
jgi:hypothetical protein